MTEYVVTKSFQDRLTKQYYGVGSIYTTDDPIRASELENRGYIAPVNTETANVAKDHAAAQEAAKSGMAANQEASERKTVVNGKVVPLKQAQAAEAAFNATVKQTGVQAHHANTTEAVQAGQVASQQTNAASQAAQQTVKQANVQSAQAHMEQHMQTAQNAQGAASQQGGLTSNMAGTINAANVSQAAQAAQTNANAAAHETAAQAGAEAAEAKAKARAKKEQ
ncbi:MAG TPA: hypothetical protein VLG50_03640 [Candidatus Saccharimonadales bacterium]|nr:hypothetical protein [Candidatus Saccharimonadales bacterium]